MRIWLLSVLFLLGITFGLKAQEEAVSKTPILIESSSYFGTIIRHSPKIKFVTKRFSRGQDVNINWQTIGLKKWQEKHKFPRVGVHFSVMNLGEPDTLGYAIGLAPNISFPIMKLDAWEFRFQLSYGLAWLNKSFNSETNPNNTAISSRINANAVFKLDNQFRLHPNWWLKAGANLIHYSNGANSIPNLGINVLAANVGISYRPRALSETARQKNGRIIFNQNRWGGDLYAGVGFRERKADNGPLYPVYAASAAVVYRATLVHHLRIGFEYEYNRSAFAFGKSLWDFQDDDIGRKAAQRWNIFYAHEFRFGAIGIYLVFGTNVNPNSILLNANIYNKYSFRYYFPEIGNPATTFYVSLNLKSQVTIAEYYSLTMGASF